MTVTLKDCGAEVARMMSLVEDNPPTIPSLRPSAP